MASKFGGVAVEDQPTGSKFGGVPADQPAAVATANPSTFNGPVARALGAIGDFGRGVVSGAGRTALGHVFQAAAPLERATGMEQRVNRPEVQQGMQLNTLPEKIGGAGETLAEFAAPTGLVGKGAKAVEGMTAGMKAAPVINSLARAGMEGAGAGAVRGFQTGDPREAAETGVGVGAGSALLRGGAAMLPNAERAGQRIGQIREQLKDVPVNIDAAAQPALRAEQLAQEKFPRPAVMKRVLDRLAPGAEPPNFRQSTDLGMNLGELSASERAMLKRPMGGAIKQTAKAIGEANQSTAEAAGMGDAYKQAMREYKVAKTLGNAKDAAVKIATKYALPGAATGAGLAAGYKAAKGLGYLGD